MTRPRGTALGQELERRLSILARGEEAESCLQRGDTLALAAVTTGSFAAVLIAQAL